MARITKEAARQIWKTACKTKATLYPDEIHKLLLSLLETLSQEVGEKGALGQFLVTKPAKCTAAKVPEIQKFALENSDEISRSIFFLSLIGKAWLVKWGRSGLESRINKIQQQVNSVFDRIRSRADDLGFSQATDKPDASEQEPLRWH